MKIQASLLLLLIGLCMASMCHASVLETTFNSPNGVQELCRILPKIDGADYKSKDLEKEVELCNTDFYSPEVALCPKTWSTSPATMVRDISEGKLSKEEYLSSNKYCGNSSKAKGKGVQNFAKFKNSMNQGSSSRHGGTSGTYSPASLAYYHISRFLDTQIRVPVAVYRELDRQYHSEVIVPKAIDNTKSKTKVGRAWRWLRETGKNPNAYAPLEELMTSDQIKYYGALLRDPGERYGPEINSRRAGGWGKRQHQEMRSDVAAFIALRNDKPALEAIADALKTAKKKSKKMANALGEVSDFQMIYWMREMAEMIVLDSIFGQQDRVGNIDYRWYWYYVTKNDKVKDAREKRDDFEELSRQEMALSGIGLPDKKWTQKVKEGTQPVLIQRTFLNDNDAALRDYNGYPKATIGRYANFPQQAAWLQGIKHFSAKLYRQTLRLNADLQSQGPIYQWAKSNLNLNDKSLIYFVENTQEVAKSLRNQCPNMVFDLNDVDDFLVEGVQIKEVDCDNP